MRWEMGYGYQEKYYQKALGEKLKAANIPFKEQVPVKITTGTSEIGKYFLDFLVDEKIIVEIKKMDKFLRKNIDQTYAYLKATNLELGILANFTKSGLQYKRIIHTHS